VKNEVIEVTDFVEQYYKRAGKGYSLNPYLFNIFTNNITKNVTKDNLHAPVTGTMTMPQLLFGDNLAISVLTAHGVHKMINQVKKYCYD
jgi:hypothetical protein